MAKDLENKIVREIGTLSTSNSGWDKMLTLNSWNGAEPKYDLRAWNIDRDRCGKGVTMTKEELIALYKILHTELGEVED